MKRRMTSCCARVAGFLWIIKGSETILSDFISRSLFVPLLTNSVGQSENLPALEKSNLVKIIFFQISEN